MGHVREHPNFVYAVVLLDAVHIEAMWLIGSSDFNRLAYRIVDGGREVLEFRGRPTGDDALQSFLIDPMQSGPAIISCIRKSPHPPQWLVALTRKGSGEDRSGA